MAIRLTSTSKVIFALAIVLLSAILGFLIWRVNQESQLDPTDSDAGGSGNGKGCCLAIYINNSWQCPYGWGGSACNAIGNASPCCGATEVLTCGDEHFCVGPGFKGYPNNCSECTDSDLGEGQDCHTGSDCPACKFPDVGFCMSGKCECKPWDTTEGVVQTCTGPGETFTCEASCPPGKIGCSSGEEGCAEVREDCVCPVCNNNTYDTVWCKDAPNSCDGGSWVNKPSGNINFEDDISFSAKAQDADGIDKASIVVKRGTTTIPVCTTGQTVGCVTLSEAATETTITGTLSNATNRLPEGTYTISMSWKDKKGATSTACALSTSFTVLPEQKNPNWTITKGVVEQCIDENTPDPKSEITYTVTVRNTGDGSGTISKIEDVLDTKVQDSFVQVSSITAPGVYSNKKIVWDYTANPLAIAAGQSKVLTYKLIVGKDAFGTYSNTVTLTPVGSSTVVAAANITADCEITEEDNPTVPATGLFDTTASRILGGFVLVIFGIAVYNLPNSKFAKKEYKYREKFERKVANR